MQHTYSEIREECVLTTAEMLRVCPDELVRAPLWTWRPADALAVLSERKRRHILQGEPEPVGDPEFK